MWEEEVRKNDCSPVQKRKMLLSDETVYGLRMTGKTVCAGSSVIVYTCVLCPTTVLSFVEMTRYLLTRPGNGSLAFLSERISQDPLENYFGMQRARGRRCDNPTLKESLVNAVAIRAQRSLELDRVQGNCRRKRRLFDECPEIDNTPLPKRKR